MADYQPQTKHVMTRRHITVKCATCTALDTSAPGAYQAACQHARAYPGHRVEVSTLVSTAVTAL